MLGSRKSRSAGSGSTTLISHDTVVVGDIRFRGNLDVEGLVQGNIIADPEADALVRVIGKGRVEGDIHAPSVVINGEVKGNVHSTGQIELAPKARVFGDVHYTLVEMAAGAEVNGSLTHVAPAQTPAKAGKATKAEKGAKGAASSPSGKDADKPIIT